MVPTLGYISQLETPPEWVVQETAANLPRAAPGPKDWCSCEDLWQLQESLGLNCSFKNVGTLAKAIQSRVLHCDRAFASVDRARADLETIRSKIRYTERIHNLATWSSWYSGFFLSNLCGNDDAVTGKFGNLDTLWLAHNPNWTLEKLGAEKLKHTRKHAHQSMVYQALLSLELQNPVERFREKMGRWHLNDTTIHVYRPEHTIQNTPRWQAECSRWLLSKLKHLVAPRVVSAVFGTIWNRWCTTKRYQQAVAPCRFCHSIRGDSIEHYSRCRVVRRCCDRMLRLDGKVHATLHSFTLACPALYRRTDLACQALLIYGTYTSFNTVKHRKGHYDDAEEAYDGLCQAVREGARGHSNSTQLLRNRWSDDEESQHRYPHPPTYPYSERQKRVRGCNAEAGRKRRRTGT